MTLLRRTALTAALAVTATSLGVVGAGPSRADVTVNETYQVPASGVFQLDGHGWGHGRGMSQYGAQGAATLGKSFQQITGFYYPQTALAQQANPWMRVWLQADTDSSTEVYPATGLKITDLATGASQSLSGYDRWRTTVDSAGLHLQGHTSTGWHALLVTGKTAVAGPLQYSGPTFVRVAFPDGSSRDYRGGVRAVRTGSTTAITVDALPMESYLLGVVPRESISSWKPAALQAQAVAARSYSEYKREHVPSTAVYDICDTTQCQVFGGSTYYDGGGNPTALEEPSTTDAVQATAGYVRTYGGKAIFAEFSSSNGGWSTDGGQPYLIAQRDDWDGVTGSSVHSWTATVSAAQLQARYPSVGTLKRMRITSRDGNGDWGGRVKTVVLEGVSSTGAATSVTTTGAGVYFANTWPASSSGLRSTWFTVHKPVISARTQGPPVATSPGPGGGAPGPVFADGRTVVVPVAGSTALRLSELNTGDVGWPGGSYPVRLGTSNPRNASSPSAGPGWLAADRPSGLGSGDTAPGSVGTFGLTLYGNNRPVGVTHEAFEPVWENQAWMGAVTYLDIVRVDPSVSRSATLEAAPPSAVALTTAPNGTATLRVRLRNTGGSAWGVGSEGLASNGFALATSSWSSSSRPPKLASNVTRPGTSAVYPGEVGEWQVPISAYRKAAGTYTLKLRALAPSGVAYGPLLTTSVRVASASFTGSVYRTSGTVQVPRNGGAFVWFDVRNTGNVPWPVHSVLRSEALYPGGSPSRASNWISAVRPGTLTDNLSQRGAANVMPGQYGRFAIVIAGNGRTPGTRSEQFDAVWETWARIVGVKVTLSYTIV
ncbi:MAG: SpoIID/LytB domain-containing protein [Mycobacteriales bacterium]